MRIWSFLLLAGCAVGPDYEEPRPSVPVSWSSGKSETADLSEWWTRYRDPMLSSLTERALAMNLDRREARARVREARAFRGAALGGLLPQTGVGGGYTRARASENGPIPSDGKEGDLYDAGFDAAWEIDVFGGNRRRLEAASADLDASVEAERDVQVSLAAETARNYIALRGIQSRIAIAQESVQTQRRIADLTRTRFDAGLATELDVARAEAHVSTVGSIIPSLEAEARRTIHALAVLLGQEPGALVRELSDRRPIPAAPAEIPIGLPSDLLRRRPDLRRAERELAAATARVGVATAELYPKFFLLGLFRFQSVGATDLFAAGSRAWSFGPSVEWALFQGGRLRAHVEAQEARREQALIRFERTLLHALREVEDALIAHIQEQVRRTALLNAVSSQRKAVELAEQRYTQGLVDFLAVLDAQRSLYEARDALAQSEQAVAAHSVALFKSVGGGWK